MSQKVNHHFFDLPPEAFKGKIPFIVTDLINRLDELHSENVEGIFRLNGGDSRIRALIADMNCKRITDWDKYGDIHTVSTALKRYFGYMADHDPIINFEYHPCFLALMSIDIVSRQIDLIHSIIQMLSQPRQITLAYLMQYLNRIHKNSDANKMTAKNLAICFGPNLIRPEEMTEEDGMQNSMVVNSAVSLMIEHCDEIFQGIQIDSSKICSEEDFLEMIRPPPNLTHIQHQIFRCQFRTNHMIPFVPLCRLINSPEYERPKDPPPPKPTNETERTDNYMTSILTRLRSTFTLSSRDDLDNDDDQSSDDTIMHISKVLRKTAMHTLQPQAISPPDPIEQPAS